METCPVKTLTLLRHAKSGWDEAVPRDFDRPLNAKGRRAALLVGQHLRKCELAFDHVVVSPAVRVTETIAGVEAGYGAALGAVEDRRAYLASAGTLLDIVRETPGDAERLLLIGHNPGLEDLVLLLVPGASNDLRDRVEEKYPTGAVAEIGFDVTDWSGVAAGGGTLTRFICPRDLDPALGPDGD